MFVCGENMLQWISQTSRFEMIMDLHSHNNVIKETINLLHLLYLRPIIYADRISTFDSISLFCYGNTKKMGITLSQQLENSPQLTLRSSQSENCIVEVRKSSTKSTSLKCTMKEQLFMSTSCTVKHSSNKPYQTTTTRTTTTTYHAMK